MENEKIYKTVELIVTKFNVYRWCMSTILKWIDPSRLFWKAFKIVVVFKRQISAIIQLHWEYYQVWNRWLKQDTVDMSSMKYQYATFRSNYFFLAQCLVKIRLHHMSIHTRSKMKLMCEANFRHCTNSKQILYLLKSRS